MLLKAVEQNLVHFAVRFNARFFYFVFCRNFYLIIRAKNLGLKCTDYGLQIVLNCLGAYLLGETYLVSASSDKINALVQTKRKQRYKAQNDNGSRNDVGSFSCPEEVIVKVRKPVFGNARVKFKCHAFSNAAVKQDSRDEQRCKQRGCNTN